MIKVLSSQTMWKVMIWAIAASNLVTAARNDEHHQIPTHCPSEDSLNQTVHLAHESDCTKFYKCNSGEKVLMECPVTVDSDHRLHFNPRLQVCDHPHQAGCKNNPTESLPINPTPKPNPPMINFTQPIWTYPATSSPVTNPNRNYTIDHNPTSCSQDIIGIYFPHETYCSLYYECVYGDLVRRKCREGRHFDSYRQTCVNPWETDCLRTTTETPSWSTTPSGTRPPITAKPVTMIEIQALCPLDSIDSCPFYPHECSCDKYYVCADGRLVVQQCLPGFHFNPVLHICEWPENAGCQATIPSRPPPTNDTNTSPSGPDTTTAKPPAKCPPDNSGGLVLLPHPKFCSLFYMCDNGKTVLLECQHGLHFNPKLQVCDRPEFAGCIATGCNNSSFAKAFAESSNKEGEFNFPVIECPRDGDVEVPHGVHCELYYECRGGEKTLKECLEGHDFNPRLRICDWPGRAGCSGDIRNSQLRQVYC